jgi:gliding motility-associated-like protein
MIAYFRTGIQLLFLSLMITTVNAQLNVNFSVDKTAGCSPLTVSFANKTTGASASAIYKWDLGNGNTSALANPSAVYTEEKVYTVTLTVQDGNQTAGKTTTITVHPKPVVDFSASVVKGCNPVNTSFMPTVQAGSGNITSYYWDFGDGSTQQTTSGITHIYTQPQKTTVILSAINSFGCFSTVSKKDFVNVLPSLIPGFRTDKDIVCRAGDPVQFTDTSSGPGTFSYTWNFSDGNTSTQQNPQHIFTTKGVYAVTMTVKSSEGCVASRALNNLNVATYKSDFDVPALICSGLNANFNNTSTPSPASYTWYVNNQMYYGFNYPLSYYFYTVGTNTVKLVNTFGTCKDSIEKQVNIKQTPSSNGFIADIKNICGAPVDVEFKDTTANAVNWEWRFDAIRSGSATSNTQNPVYKYTLKDQYTVVLNVTNADGCKKSITKYVNVRGPEVYINYFDPDDPFKSISDCAGKRIGFKAGTSEEIISWNWNFGDGTSSIEEKPVHAFTAGTYNITLTYTTKKGCTAVSTINGFVIHPQAKITDFTVSPNPICGNAPVAFKATATITPSTAALYYYWDFGDGVSTGLQYGSSISHQYFKDSNYTVTLMVTGPGWCPDTLTKSRFVNVLPPVPKISAIKNTCDGLRNVVTFEQTSVKAQGWTWDFGDGATTTLTTDQPSITHTYAKSGAYKVVLTTTNGACSVRDSGMAYVLYKQHPLLTATATEVCKNGPVTITISNLDPNPYTNNQYNYWIHNIVYGDGSTVIGGNWNYIYFQSTYSIPLYNLDITKKDLMIITNYIGSNSIYDPFCRDTTNVVPLVIKGPIPGYEVTANNVCLNNPASFRDTSKSVGGTIQKWEWEFGDGQKSTHGPAVTHTYSNPGNYFVTLKVTDNTGCPSSGISYYTPVQVTGPKAAFAASSTSVALAGTVNFTNNTNNYNVSGTTYRWQIDGVDFSTDYNTSYTFNQPGTYTITLIATNSAKNCSSTASQVITVKNFNAAFSVSTTAITPNSCPPVLVRFTNTSQNYTSIKWDFGDGAIIENVNTPSHFYNKAGKYLITLYVYGANGINGTFYDSVTIVQPEAVIQSSALDVCKGTNITLNAIASNTGSYVWDFGDGSVITTTDTFASHQYVTPGVYSPALIMKQAVTGCTGSVPLADKVNVRPDPVVTITPALPVICKGAAVPLQASGGVAYEWLPANDLNNTTIANPVASPAQTSSYSVKVTDDIGCKNTENITITVIQPVQVVVTGDNELCQGEATNLKASGAEVYKWINNITGLNDINIPNPVAMPGASTTYTVTGADRYSCFSDTTAIAIMVRPSPSVDAGQDVQSWPSEPVQLQATGSSDIINWKWTPADYLNCTDCANPLSTPLTSKSYAITVKNQYGCAATDTIVVKVLCNENRVRIPNGFTPNGDGKNDEFMIKGIAIIKHLTIFNRWGQKVYDRSNFVAGDRSLCWNGTFNGYPAEAGTYVYFVEMDCPEGTFTRKGTMTLIR